MRLRYRGGYIHITVKADGGPVHYRVERGHDERERIVRILEWHAGAARRAVEYAQASLRG